MNVTWRHCLFFGRQRALALHLDHLEHITKLLLGAVSHAFRLGSLTVNTLFFIVSSGVFIILLLALDLLLAKLSDTTFWKLPSGMIFLNSSEDFPDGRVW